MGRPKYPTQRTGLRAGETLSRSARAVVASAVRAGAIAYDRSRDLPKLIRLDPLRADSMEAADQLEWIVARLERALRSERQKARSGHWTYDLNRHIALRQAHTAEVERLAAIVQQRVSA